MVSDQTQSNPLPQERLRALYQIIERMNSVYELPDLLAFILDRVLEHTGGKRGYLLLTRPGTDDAAEPCLEVEAMRGEGLDAHAKEDALRFVSSTVVRDVLQRGQIRVIEDLQQDERYRQATGLLSAAFKWRSIVAIPLKATDRLIGLMYIEHPGQNAFPNPDLDFISAFAGQAAVAIDRARQSQRRIEELERLSEVSRAVVRVLDLDQVLTRIMHEAIRLLDVETGSVLLVDDRTNELTFRVSVRGGRPVSISQRLQVGAGSFAGWVAERGEPLLVADVRQDPRWFGEVENDFSTRSVLCVPLKTGERVIGVVQALNKKSPSGFTERDLSLLSAFAATATIAIENAQLFAEARQARELRALNEVAVALGSTLELKSVLETGLVKALEAIQVEAGAISLVDEASGDLEMAATHGWRRASVPVGTRIPAGQGLSGQVVSTGETLITSDVQHDPRVAIPDFRDEGVQAMAMVPVRAGGQVVGVLSVMSYTPHRFTQEEINMLSTLGGMFGVAIGNVRLYDKVRANLTQLSYLNTVGGALTASLDLEHVLRIIMEGLTSLIGVERASIFLIDPATGDLVLEYSLGGQESIRLPAPWPGIAGWIAIHGESIIVNDVRSDARWASHIDTATQFDTRSILGAPLKLDERIIGAIEMLNKRSGPFTENDRELLVGFSKWAAIALHNARLYQELDEAKERLATAEAIAAMSDMALNLTHRLNNRISVARVDASRIQAKCQAELRNPYLAQKIEEIYRVTTESLDIIRRIRKPFEMAEVEPVNVSDCLAEALQTFQIASNVQVEEHYQPNLPPVMATREKLVETFGHIIGNALDAITARQAGRLQISTRYRPDRLVEVIIADNGPGISPEAQAHLFEPFFTAKGREGRGLGLGLWLTRMYISRLGGQVKLESALGQGTVVRIHLPAVQERSS